MHLYDRAHYMWAHLRHRPSGYEALTYNYFLLRFAAGLVDVFGIVFLFQLGDGLVEGVWMAVWYVVFQRLVVIVSLLPGGKIVERIGYRRSMLVGELLLMGKYLAFTYVSPGLLWPLLPAFVCGGLFISLYFTAYHGLFLDDNDDARIGSQSGLLDMLGRLATVVSPLMAGMIVARWGFDVLFMLGLLFIVASVGPLLFMPHHHHAVERVSWAAVWKEIRLRVRFRRVLAFFHIQSAVLDVLWPIYVFLLLGSYEVFGSLYAFVMLVSGIAVWGAGKLYDNRPLHRVYPFVSMSMAVLWVGRFMAQSVVALFAVDGISRVLSPFWWMKIRRYELGKGEKMSGVVFGIAHELVLSVAKLAGLMIAMGLWIGSGYRWEILALPAMVGVLASGYLMRNR